MLRLLEPHLAFAHILARRFRLGQGQRDGGALGLTVEPREHLSFGNRHAFFDVHFDHFARNLRRHRRAAAGRDITGGIQHGSLRPRLPRRDRCDFDRDGALAAEPPPGTAARSNKEDGQHEPSDPAPAGGSGRRFPIEPQRGEFLFEVCHYALPANALVSV